MNKKLPERNPPLLRTAAEAQLATARLTAAPIRPAEEILHELQVHEIELEMQNESLRQTQQSLEESRDRYVDLYDFAPVGYLTLTREALICETNLTCAAMLRVDRRKLVHRRFAHFVAAEDLDLWYRHFLHVAVHGKKQRCELTLQRGDGSRLYVQMDCAYQANDGEAPTIRIAIADHTERKHAEEELRIAAIAFESQEGMVVTDVNGVILRVNQAFTRLTGYSAAEVVGKTPELLRSGRHDRIFYEQMYNVLQEKHYWQGEMWNLRKNGKVYADWLTVSAVTAPDGQITHYVGTFSDITKDREAEAEIHRLAYYDALTQLPNRRLLQDRLGQALAATSRNGHCGAILFLDLDNFKMLNDTRGHEVGDLLLVEVARRLQACVRAGDTVARPGGDEFVILLEDLSGEIEEAATQSKQLGDKMREAVALPYHLRDCEYHCTASIGIGLFCDNNVSIEELLMHADLSMYQAKDAGRNSLRFFDPDMQQTLDTRSALENDLRQACDRQQMCLYYQPQVDSVHGVIGAEALLRWMHPERGLVTPDEFIPLAEETGLILSIGYWVLETACAQLKAWEGNWPTRDMTLSINVSARQFRQTDFVSQVKQALHRTGADPARLKIELTESLVHDNVRDIISKMQSLKDIGVGFSMDDFGTGYSSLSYLKQLPLDQLKIDRSFVKDLPNDSNSASIVKAIITMGQTFGLDVIAEGVETTDQRDFLQRHGCHAFQGYLFSRPFPLTEGRTLSRTGDDEQAYISQNIPSLLDMH